jgi:EmrB/QacA subfamily drug resistance transporter
MLFLKTKTKLSSDQLMLISTVALGVLLNPLNSSTIAVALPRFQQEFRLSFADLSWLISTYYLASAIGQPVMGKVGDLWGHRRVFFIGLILIAISSVIAPFSPSFLWLIVFRMIQAVGSSMLFPAGMAMIRKKITENQAQALGVLSIFSSISAAFGPSVGGFLIAWKDWPAIFYVNFPFIILSFVLALKILPHEERAAGTKKVQIDGWGIVFFSAMMIFWILFLLEMKTGFHVSYFTASIVLTIIFYLFEARKEAPFINVISLKKNPVVSLIYLQFIIVNIIFYSVFFGLPSYLQNVLHYSPGHTGIVMLSIAGLGVILAPIAGKWIDTSGSKPSLMTGSSFLLAGTLLLLLIGDDTSFLSIFLVLSVLGVSNGFNNIGLQTALYAHVPRNETGAASGLFMTSRYIGTILSSSLLGILFGTTITTEHFHTLAWSSSVLALIVLVMTIKMPGKTPNEAQREKIG